MSTKVVGGGLLFCVCPVHRRRKVSKSVWAMASAVARAYNGGLGAEPPVGVQGAEPPETIWEELSQERD